MKADTETKHTPGPWGADHCTEPSPSPGYFQIDAPLPEGLRTYAPYTVADTSNRDFRISPEEDEANARLIAASPELGAELFRALAVITTPQAFDIEGVRADISAVLQKAGLL